MKNKPQKLTISEQREQEIKNKYNYSEVHVFSPSFLEEYKEAILKYFPDQQDELRENMEKITEFIIGDRVNNGLSRLCCTQQVIHMDTQYADISEDSFTLKPDCQYIQTIFVHELLHAASRQTGNKRNLTGILDFIRDENGNVVNGPNNRKYVALNEGITQFFAERIVAPVPNEIDSYTVNKQVAYLLSDVLGEEVLKGAYFGHTSVLKDTLNSLAGDENYFEELNRQLDTINKLETTIRRIESNKLNPADRDECLARMREVSRAQQAAMMEGLFSKVIIPQVQKIEVPANVSEEEYNAIMEKRQLFLLPILKDNPELFRYVAKYIPKHIHSEFIRDDILTEIQKEIKENGMSFEKISQVARSTNDRYILGPKIAKDFISAVDEFYDQNQDALKDRTTTLTPLLKRQLEKMVNILDRLEALAKADPELQKQVISYREDFMEKHFHMIPDLNLEIEKIREERRKGHQQETKPKTESFDPIENAKKKGSTASQEDAHRPIQPEEETEKAPEQEKKHDKNYYLSDKFVISNLTGAITDQRKLSIYDKAVNIAVATGDKVTVDDGIIAEARDRAIEKYRASLPSMPPGNLGKIYGDRWREVLIEAFAEGYEIGMKHELNKAAEQGLKQREEVEKQVESGKYKASTRTVDFEEMKFVCEHFEVKQTESGDVVVEKETGQPVLDERTKKITAFASEWIKINQDASFTKESEELFRFLEVEMKKEDVKVEEILADAEAMGHNYKKVAEALLTSEEGKKKVEEFFAITNQPKVEEVDKKESPLEENEYSSISLEEATEALNRYNVATPRKENEPEKPVFRDPVVAAKINARYRELKGEDHPAFVAEAPGIIEKMQQNKDSFIQAGVYSKEYFDKLAEIKKDLEIRHPELVSDSKEKTGSK